MFPYKQPIEQAMKDYFETLTEKDRRRYAGIEAMKLGHGGIKYVAELFGTERQTVRKGMQEATNMSAAEKENKQIRKKGADDIATTKSIPT